MLRRVWLLLVPLSLLAATVTTASAQTTTQTDPGPVVRRFFDAFNQHDLATIGNLLSDDVISVVAGGPCDLTTPCFGKAATLRAAQPDPGMSIQVLLLDTLQVSGSTMTVRTETRLSPMPPPFQAAGIQRLIGIERLTVTAGKISAVGSMFDLADAQTRTFVGLIATQPGQPATVPTANDGTTLAMQPPATRITFIETYGADADRRWVDEHNAALGQAGH